MTKKKQAPFIHIRLENDEAVRMKKDLLYLEISVVRALQIINRYKKLREKNYEYKKLLKEKIKQTHSDLNKLKKTLPKIDKTSLVEKIEKKYNEDLGIEESVNKKIEKRTGKSKKASKKASKKTKKSSDEEIEKNKEKELQEELRTIQEQLRKLGGI